MKKGISVLAMLALVQWLGAMPAHAEDTKPTPTAEPQAVADKIAVQIEQIRGLAFKQPVKVELQSTEDFSKYVSRELDEVVSDSIRSHYGLIVRALGLYRGPPIEDFSGMMTAVMTSQVGAYYDPEKRSFYILMGELPEMMQGVMYSHELYHALQDQYFDLQRYMKPDAARGAEPFSGDTQLARSATVEGEATYMMSLWMMQKMTGKPATREMMTQVVSMQANMDMNQLREMIKQPQVAEMMGSDLNDAMAASADIPSFIMDSMIGVYLKGLNFIFAIQEKGWPAVEKLYTEYPAQSTEHILHPEKWLAREAPANFKWPKFEKVAALEGWELMDEDVLGEFQWRVVFKEQGFAKEAEAAAAGWGGDRYAVFKRKDSEATLLLLRTSWDTEAEAREFAEVYRRVQATKNADAPVATRLLQKGVDVFIVEGGDEAAIDSLLKVVRGVKRART